MVGDMGLGVTPFTRKNENEPVWGFILILPGGYNG